MNAKILLFLSIITERSQLSDYLCPDGNYVSGLQTNEAPVKYLIKKHPDVSEIVCVVTPQAKNTAAEYFTRAVYDIAPDITITEIPFDESGNTPFTEGPLQQIIDRFNKGDHLLLETTGGQRDAIMYLLLVSRILSYIGVETTDATYSNLGTRIISDITGVVNLFDMVGGMQELTSFGNVNTLRAYFRGQTEDPHIDRLLSAMERLSESFLLCRTANLNEMMEEFNNALDEAQNSQNPLFCKMLPAFRSRFGSDGRLSLITLIRWYLDCNMVQQALTVYTEYIPERILNGANGTNVIGITPAYKNRCNNAASSWFYRDFINVFLMLDNTTNIRYRRRINTIEHLETYLSDAPGNTYYGIKGENPLQIFQIKQVCRDYLYLKTLRNMANHASDDASCHPELLSYFLSFGYINPEDASVQDVKKAVNDALYNMRPMSDRQLSQAYGNRA